MPLRLPLGITPALTGPYWCSLAPETGGTWPSSPLFKDLVLGSVQLGDFAAEQVPLLAVRLHKFFVLMVHANCVDQRLAHICLMRDS
jgi:hypothetical protein